MPKYSIIIPVYKAEKYIRRCVDSVLLQTESDWELILIDDGSPDSSGSICDEYATRDIRIKVYHKENGGVSSARNLGIVKASGVWISFVDSDDWVDSTYLESFNCPDEPSTRSIYVQGIAFSVPDGRVMNNMFTYPHCSFKSTDIDYWYKYDILKNGCPVAKLFNRKLLVDNNIQFDERLTFNEDHLFVTDYYRYVESINLSPNVCYHYFFDYKVESLTKKAHSSKEYLEISTKLCNSLKQLCDSLNTLPSKICSNEVHYIFGLGQIAFASLSSIGEKERYEKYKACVLLYKTNHDIHNVKGVDFYSHYFLLCMIHKKYIFGFYGAFVYYYGKKTYRWIINTIKKMIFRG